MAYLLPYNYRMKANRYRLRPDRDTERTLRMVGDRVSALWNAANYSCRGAFLSSGKKRVPGYVALCDIFKRHGAYRALPSDVAQETLKKLSEAWGSYFEVRALWKAGQIETRPGLPKYRKDRTTGKRPMDLIPIKSDRSYRIDAHRISVTLPADLRRVDGGRLEIPYLGLRRYIGKGKRGELRYDGGRGRWYFHQSVEAVDNRPKRSSWSKAAAIDLGIRNLVSLSVEGEHGAIHFSGREVLEDFDYWGRRIATHQKELSHRPKGERSSKRLKRLYSKRRDRLTHAWEAIASRVVAALKLRKVGVVYIGWPKDIRREVSYGKKLNGRIHNFWSFDRASRILEKHLRRAGIAIERARERGTSSTCPCCDSENVVRRPWDTLRCEECGARMDSDVAGSRNILARNKPAVRWETPSGEGAEAAPEPELLWWNKHRWRDVPNRSSAEEPLVV
jgi:putative transposase